MGGKSSRSAREAKEAAWWAREELRQYKEQMKKRHAEEQQRRLEHAEQLQDQMKRQADYAKKQAAEAQQRLKEEKQRRFEEAAEAKRELEEQRVAAEEKIAAELAQERARVHAEKLREWQQLNRDYPIPEFLLNYVTPVLENVHEDQEQDPYINIAILGDAGTGKSSLIKAILTYFNSSVHDGLAPTSCFEGDGTRAPTPYLLSQFNDRVILWDLPGQGTLMFPAKTYLREMGLKYFDAVLNVTDGRWSENDGRLLDAIRFAGIWNTIVRTKVDLAVDDGENDHGLGQDETLERVRRTLSNQLQEFDPKKLHLVTTRKKFWAGLHGGTKFGNIDELCECVADHIEGRSCCRPVESQAGTDVYPQDSVSSVSYKSRNDLVQLSGNHPVIAHAEGFAVDGNCFQQGSARNKEDCSETDSWITVSSVAKCFMPDHLFKTWGNPASPDQGVFFQSACDLKIGSCVANADGTRSLQVTKIKVHETSATIALQAGEGATQLQVTASHRILVPADTTSNSAERVAGDLQMGDSVLCTDGPRVLTHVTALEKTSNVLEISFDPDEPVAVFHPPPAVILTKGTTFQNKTRCRRSGMNKRAFGKTVTPCQAEKASIPDTDWEFLGGTLPPAEQL